MPNLTEKDRAELKKYILEDLSNEEKTELKKSFIQDLRAEQVKLKAEIPDMVEKSLLINFKDIENAKKAPLNSLASLYQFYILDSVIDTAYAVSIDFSQRPEVYKDISPTLQLVILRRSLGNLPFFPDKATRVKELYMPFFDKNKSEKSGNDSSRFKKTSHDLILACKAYSENKLESTTAALMERVKISNRRFNSYLNGVLGSAQTAASAQVNSVFEISRTILKDTAIQRIFGVNVDKLDDSWPFEVNIDWNGATLIQNISNQLKDHYPNPNQTISLDKFTNLQLIAASGKSSIESSGLDLDDPALNDPKVMDSNINKLVANVYTWGSELGILT